MEKVGSLVASSPEAIRKELLAKRATLLQSARQPRIALQTAEPLQGRSPSDAVQPGCRLATPLLLRVRSARVSPPGCLGWGWGHRGAIDASHVPTCPPLGLPQSYRKSSRHLATFITKCVQFIHKYITCNAPAAVSFLQKHADSLQYVAGPAGSRGGGLGWAPSAVGKNPTFRPASLQRPLIRQQ